MTRAQKIEEAARALAVNVERVAFLRGWQREQNLGWSSDLPPEVFQMLTTSKNLVSALAALPEEDAPATYEEGWRDGIASVLAEVGIDPGAAYERLRDRVRTETGYALPASPPSVTRPEPGCPTCHHTPHDERECASVGCDCDHSMQEEIFCSAPCGGMLYLVASAGSAWLAQCGSCGRVWPQQPWAAEPAAPSVASGTPAAKTPTQLNHERAARLMQEITSQPPYTPSPQEPATCPDGYTHDHDCTDLGCGGTGRRTP
jgi:hypothetical protein